MFGRAIMPAPDQKKAIFMPQAAGAVAARARALAICLAQFGTHGLSLDRKKRIATSVLCMAEARLA